MGASGEWSWWKQQTVRNSDDYHYHHNDNNHDDDADADAAAAGRPERLATTTRLTTRTRTRRRRDWLGSKSAQLYRKKQHMQQITDSCFGISSGQDPSLLDVPVRSLPRVFRNPLQHPRSPRIPRGCTPELRLHAVPPACMVGYHSPAMLLPNHHLKAVLFWQTFFQDFEPAARDRSLSFFQVIQKHVQGDALQNCWVQPTSSFDHLCQDHGSLVLLETHNGWEGQAPNIPLPPWTVEDSTTNKSAWHRWQSKTLKKQSCQGVSILTLFLAINNFDSALLSGVTFPLPMLLCRVFPVIWFLEPKVLQIQYKQLVSVVAICNIWFSFKNPGHFECCWLMEVEEVLKEGFCGFQFKEKTMTQSHLKWKAHNEIHQNHSASQLSFVDGGPEQLYHVSNGLRNPRAPRDSILISKPCIKSPMSPTQPESVCAAYIFSSLERDKNASQFLPKNLSLTSSTIKLVRYLHLCLWWDSILTSWRGGMQNAEMQHVQVLTGADGN